MKKLLLSLLLCLPMALQAQEDAKYLAGAVPEENGKVVFTTQLAVEGQSKANVYEHMKAWAESVTKRTEAIDNKNRIVLADENKGEIILTAEEYLVFNRNGFVLDRTRIYYNLHILCEAGICKVQMLNIRYLYDENLNGGIRYTAEEVITDKECLNKDHTKLVKAIAKFRRKTIDLKDELFDSASKAFGFQSITTAKKIETAPVQMATPVKQTEPVKQEKKPETESPLQDKTTPDAKRTMKEVDVHIAPSEDLITPKDTVSFTTQEGSAIAELLQKTEKATLTIISENGTAQVLQFKKIKEEKSKDGKTCTYTGELSK